MEFKLPEVGENITQGQVVKVTVNDGDQVKKDQTLFELETEKATLEVPSPAAGTVKDIQIKQGDTVEIGQTMMTIAESAEPEKKSGEEQAEQEKQTKDQENEEKAEESQEEGKEANEQEPEEKERPEPEEKEETQKEEKNIQKSTKNKQKQPTKPELQEPESSEMIESLADVHAAPSVRRLARELGVDIRSITGSGPNGLIVQADVKKHTKQIVSQASGGTTTTAQKDLPDFSRWGEVERQDMNNIRKATSQHLSHAWTTIPHVTQYGKADITQLEELRKKSSTADNKLTITPFIMKVISAALKHFPRFNASLDMTSREIIFKKYIHLGVAVDTDNGLLVPVIRDVDQKNIMQLSQELHEIAARARGKKLGLDDMKGGCFTITNLGGLGAGYFAPIVNWPEVAILGVSRAEKEPCFHEETCSPRLKLPLSLAYDHRVIDGADGARFIKWVCDAIENPFMLELN
ncbi:MAG: 2-oxo acid dehydrogenase subunit E2 [Candidatus Omnitrophota bacterium]